MLGITQAWGAKWSYTLTETPTGNKTWNNVAWTITMSGGSASTYSSTQGAHWGTNSSTCNSVTLTSSGFSSNTISSIVIEASRGSSLTGTLGVKVNNTSYKLHGTNNTTHALTTSNATYTFDGSSTGNVEIKWTKSSGKGAFYIKSITVYFYTNVSLKKNEGSEDGSVKFDNDASSYVTNSFDEVTRSGYNCTGYYTASSCGTKVLNANGTFASNNITVSSTEYVKHGKWAYTGGTLDLYAQWESAAACTATPTVGVVSLKGSFF